MPKQEKVQLVENIKSELKASGGLVVANFKGLTVAELDSVRRKVEAEGGKAKVVKNTLLEKAFDAVEIKGLEPVLKGNTILFYSKEEALKIFKPIAATARENDKFVIKGGVYDGQVLDKAGVIEMSKMPGRKDLLAMLAGGMNAVLATFLATLEELEKKKSEGGETPQA
jgi:large subunit ribosomal protein L10